MTIDLELDDVDAELAASVRRYCEGRDPTPFASWWTGLAELGVLGLGTPEGGGTAGTIVAAMEELGRANAPGPLAATFMATRLLDGPAREAIASGAQIVAVGSDGLIPWLPLAGVVIEVDDGSAYLARVTGPIDSVETLGDEPWGRATLERITDLGSAGEALAVANVAIAAYLAGNGSRLLDETAAYAADRIQFRQPIGAFQAVAHPLAESYIRLTAARTLARAAAHALDSSAPHALAAAATARLSASNAALAAAFHCHQTYGAMGFTVEGPVGTRSARIRQTSMLPPRDGQVRATVLAGHGL